MSALVEIQHVTKTYKNALKPSVDNLSFQINTGTIFGLLGPNGAGKTTLISMLCGLFLPNSGHITINGFNHQTNSKACKQIIGVVPQEIALYPTLTALENLIFLGNMYGLNHATLKKKIKTYLQIFGLEDYTHQKISTFSGGMKRRVNLIAGILHQPQLLILDEPTVGVDIQSKNAIINQLKTLNKENGTTILYTSHHLDEAEDFCSHIAIIDEGKLITQGHTQELIQTHYCQNIEDVYLKITGNKFRD